MSTGKVEGLSVHITCKLGYMFAVVASCPACVLIVQSLKAKIIRSFNKITLMGCLTFLNSLVCVLASQKKIPKNSLGKYREKGRHHRK